ncbi:MAG: hypothetical protein IKX66_04325, partial [Clostridia bacterium]|nr:hypothetical protein [Clostridia bacterium]
MNRNLSHNNLLSIEYVREFHRPPTAGRLPLNFIIQETGNGFALIFSLFMPNIWFLYILTVFQAVFGFSKAKMPSARSAERDAFRVKCYAGSAYRADAAG